MSQQFQQKVQGRNFGARDPAVVGRKVQHCGRHERSYLQKYGCSGCGREISLRTQLLYLNSLVQRVQNARQWMTTMEVVQFKRGSALHKESLRAFERDLEFRPWTIGDFELWLAWEITGCKNILLQTDKRVKVVQAEMKRSGEWCRRFAHRWSPEPCEGKHGLWFTCETCGKHLGCKICRYQVVPVGLPYDGERVKIPEPVVEVEADMTTEYCGRCGKDITMRHHACGNLDRQLIIMPQARGPKDHATGEKAYLRSE